MLQLTRKKKASTGTLVGLDVEAGSVAVTEIDSNGSLKVKAAAVEPLAPGAFQEGEVTDPDSVAEALKSLFAARKLSKDVRLGVANQRVIVRTLRLPAIEDPREMTTAIRFQAQEQISMPLDQAILEHRVIGGVPEQEGAAPLVEVVVVAARREMVRSFLEPVRRAGLNPVGLDLSAFGMIRALAGVGTGEVGAMEGDGAEADAVGAGQRPSHSVLYCNLGAVMNLAVARGRACLFTRVSSEGLEAIASRLATESGLEVAHATQWLSHVGLEYPLEQIEGDPRIVADVRSVLERGVSGLVDELRLSLDYYAAQESAVPVERIVLCGPGSTIAGLPERMAETIGLPVATARPPALAEYGDEVAARLTLPFGLALEH